MASFGRLATMLGTGAILLWATLATLTTLEGPHPAVPDHGHRLYHRRGACPCSRPCCGAGCICMRPTPASLALGIYGLFGYHALYFAALKLAPPAEAHLISSLWALLTVLFSGLLPGARPALAPRAGARLLGLAAAAILVWDQLGSVQGTDAKRLGFALALGCALVWSTYSVASRLLAGVPSESDRRVLPGDGRARLRLQPPLRAVDHAGRPHRLAGAAGAWARARSAPPSCCGTSA